jgi:hypothetical protein
VPENRPEIFVNRIASTVNVNKGAARYQGLGVLTKLCVNGRQLTPETKTPPTLRAAASSYSGLVPENVSSGGRASP